MAMTWLTLRTQVRRLLQDNKATGTPRWSNEQLLDCAIWALNSLCAHTALATATSFTCDGETSDFTIPDNLYEDIVRSGAVYLDDGFSVSYINPVPTNRRDRSFSGYYVNGRNILHMIMKPSIGSILTVYYFALYPHPVYENDLILAPMWATAALAYLISAYAVSSYSVKLAGIRQWNTKQDSGNPEQSPVEDMYEVYMEAYERELSRVPLQQRENYWRSDLINGYPKPVVR